MTGIEIAAVISSISSLIAAGGSAVAVVMGARNGRKIEQVHKATNSLTDRLVETTRTEAHAAGVREGEDNPRPVM